LAGKKKIRKTLNIEIGGKKRSWEVERLERVQKGTRRHRNSSKGISSKLL